jgi:hypothetical protein
VAFSANPDAVEVDAAAGRKERRASRLDSKTCVARAVGGRRVRGGLGCADEEDEEERWKAQVTHGSGGGRHCWNAVIIRAAEKARRKQFVSRCMDRKRRSIASWTMTGPRRGRLTLFFQ